MRWSRHAKRPRRARVTEGAALIGTPTLASLPCVYNIMCDVVQERLEMPDQAVAFLAQPIQMMARRGEGFTNLVIETLRRWIASDYVETVRAHHHGQLFALSAEPSTQWHVLVLRHGHKHADFGASVCGVEFGIAQEAIEHFLPLVGIDHIQPAIQVRMGKIEAKMFTALAVGQGYEIDSFVTPGLRLPDPFQRRVRSGAPAAANRRTGR
jgi:hypothetical protein